MKTIEQMYNDAKALVEDRTYNIGEISEKTGLQKTANGWVKPSETKFGKVKQNKNGEWGVQPKQGKNSRFIKHKNESDAKNALANYTRGYNTTEKSKQDPHSEEARQIKHWDKETEKIRKENKAQRRAERAAQFISGSVKKNNSKPDKKPSEMTYKEAESHLNEKQKELLNNMAKQNGKSIEEIYNEFKDVINFGKRDPKLMEELERSNRFKQEKMAKERQKKEDEIKQQRQEGEANARAFQEKVERGEIVYNEKTGQFEDGPKEKSKWEKTTDYLGRERITMKTKQGGTVHIYESKNPKQKNERFKVDTGSHTNTFNTMEEAKAFAEKHYGDTKENKSKEKNTEKKAERKPVDNWEETRMASGKIYDTPDKSYRIIERKDIDTGESTFDIRNLKNNRAEDIKGIKSLEEAKAFVEKNYGNESNSVKRKQETKDSACRITADTKIRLKK